MEGMYRRIPISTIIYVEVSYHQVLYHTTEGVFKTWGALKKIRESLPEDRFSLCSASFLVNLDYVKAVNGKDLIVGTDRLHVSRSRKKQLMADIAN